jgi:hypothetical protein
VPHARALSLAEPGRAVGVGVGVTCRVETSICAVRSDGLLAVGEE